MMFCDRCGASGADTFDDCPECGPIELCPACASRHRQEIIPDRTGDDPIGYDDRSPEI